MCNKKHSISDAEFFQLFPNQYAAQKYLEKICWGQRPICPSCKRKRYIKMRRRSARLFRCSACGCEFTIRTGTFLKRSHVPLHLWLYAIFILLSHPKGISSIKLGERLGVRQETAWSMAHRIREGLSQKIIKRLKNITEMDEAYVGGLEKNKHANKRLHVKGGVGGKDTVLGARERGGNVILKHIDNQKYETIRSEVKNMVMRGSMLMTDECPAYKGIKGYKHKFVCHSAEQFVDKDVHTNSIESVWAIVKRQFKGTHHLLSAKYLQHYLNEIAYRINEWNKDMLPVLDKLCNALRRIFSCNVTHYQENKA